MQCGIHFVDDLLGVHADGVNGGNHNQNEQHEQNCVLADVLTFFSLDLYPTPTEHRRLARSRGISVVTYKC